MKLLEQDQSVVPGKELSRKITSISMEAELVAVPVDLKDKISSNASLQRMHPVASGDNMAAGLNSAHKLKDELPPLIPCVEGRELPIREEVVVNGLSAISVKNDTIIQQCASTRCDKLPNTLPGIKIREEVVVNGLRAISVKNDTIMQQCASTRCDKLPKTLPGIKHRNSFRCLHRPDLKRVPYLRRMSPDELETIFKGFSDTNSFFRQESSKLILPEEGPQKKEKFSSRDVTYVNGLRQIPETRSEDVPIGMRLHGARARLYTSILTGVKTGDQLDATSLSEDLFQSHLEDSEPEDIPLHEELQIILPPRAEDLAETPTTTYSDLGSMGS